MGWKKISVRGKMSAFFLVFFQISILALVMLGYQFNRAMNRMDVQTQDYYHITAFSDAFLMADRELEDMVRRPMHSALRVHAFEEARQEADGYLQKMSAGLTTEETERYLLVTAIRSGYSDYMENADAILTGLRAGERDERHYYRENAVTAAFLHKYTIDLLTHEISSGRAMHARSRNAINSMFYGWIAAFFAMNLAAIFGLFRLCDRAFLRPVRGISDALQSIEAGNFDIPDLETDREDEIARLVAVFNTMKHSTKQLVMTLREKNELEHALHLRVEADARRQQQLELARYAHLKSQVNPHFLFNTLNIISRVARVENAEKTEELIVSLARTFRYSLSSDAPKTTLAREMESIDDYMRLQQIRFGDRVRFAWRVAPGLDPNDMIVVPYTLQPFVENAIVHGLRDTVKGGKLRVTIGRREDALLLRITDNGEGMSRARLEAVRRFDAPQGGEHIGIYNVRYRLKLLSAESRLQIDSWPGYGTCVQILIPQGGLTNEDIGCG